MFSFRFRGLRCLARSAAEFTSETVNSPRQLARLLSSALLGVCSKSADKSLARPGRKEPARVKRCDGQRNGLIWLG